MTTEASPNETRLPRAVRERMTRINATLEARTAAAVAAPPPHAASVPGAGVTETDALPEPAASTSQPANPGADARENDPAYWRQRFSVTQGMLRTQRDQFEAQLEAKDRDLTELRQRVQALEAGNPQSNSAPEVSLFFTPEQVNQFGEDQCRAMASVAIKAAQQQAQTLIDAEVKPIKDKAAADAQSAQKAKETKFWDQLTELFPRWEEVNATDAWLAWLTETDDDTGMGRQAILNSHHQAFNALGVAKLFQAFEKSKHRQAPPVAPARSTASGASDGAVPQTHSKGYPTETEIKDFYKRSTTVRNPRDPRYVTDKERVEFEARLKSRATA